MIFRSKIRKLFSPHGVVFYSWSMLCFLFLSVMSLVHFFHYFHWLSHPNTWNFILFWKADLFIMMCFMLNVIYLVFLSFIVCLLCFASLSSLSEVWIIFFLSLVTTTMSSVYAMGCIDLPAKIFYITEIFLFLVTLYKAYTFFL